MKNPLDGKIVTMSLYYPPSWQIGKKLVPFFLPSKALDMLKKFLDFVNFDRMCLYNLYCFLFSEENSPLAPLPYAGFEFKHFVFCPH
jgi:hypothetical protein